MLFSPSVFTFLIFRYRFFSFVKSKSKEPANIEAETTISAIPKPVFRGAPVCPSISCLLTKFSNVLNSSSVIQLRLSSEMVIFQASCSVIKRLWSMSSLSSLVSSILTTKSRSFSPFLLCLALLRMKFSSSE